MRDDDADCCPRHAAGRSAVSVVLGGRQVCDGPDCESPEAEGEVCSAPLGAAGWITREKDGEVRHFCDESCEREWLDAMDASRRFSMESFEGPPIPTLTTLCDGCDRCGEMGHEECYGDCAEDGAPSAQTDVFYGWVEEGDKHIRAETLSDLLTDLYLREGSRDNQLPGHIVQKFRDAELWVGPDATDAEEAVPQTESQAATAIFAAVPALEHLEDARPSYTFDEIARLERHIRP